jgi:hypothetical protein
MECGSCRLNILKTCQLRGATCAFCYQFGEVLTLLFFLHLENGHFSILMKDIFVIILQLALNLAAFLQPEAGLPSSLSFYILNKQDMFEL